MTLPADSASALAEISRGLSLFPQAMPASFYLSEQQHAEEITSVFLQEWLCVGRADEVPNSGDYYTTKIIDEPLIVCRVSATQISVLSNVCRHRGSLILNGSGNVSRFICPYHQWSYELSGKLIAAPRLDHSMGIDQAVCNLPAFKTTTWMGWLFVNLDGQAEEFNIVVAGADEYICNYHTEQMRTVSVNEEIWPLNWKCLVENFMEGYHLTPVHRNTLHPMTPTRLCEKISAGKGYTGYRSRYSNSFQGRCESHPDMTTVERAQSMMMWIYPSTVMAVSPDSTVYMSITPTGAQELKTRWGVIARESLFESGEAQKRYDFACEFNAEDRQRLLSVQQGLRSRYTTRGPLAPADYEGTVWDFYNYMAKMLTKNESAF